MDNFSAPIPESFVFFRSMTVTTNALFFVRLLREPVQEEWRHPKLGMTAFAPVGPASDCARQAREVCSRRKIG